MTTTLQWRRARSGSHGIAIYPLIKTNQTKQIAYYNTNHRKLKKDNLIWFIILLLLPILRPNNGPMGHRAHLQTLIQGSNC